MRLGLAAGITVSTVGALLLCAPVVAADPPPPGCERVPMFGLNPQIREICDGPIYEDGSWERWRWFWHPEFVHSTCGDYAYRTSSGYVCPDWAPKDTIPAEQSPVDRYIVTWDTIPPGEPGHID